MPGSVTVSFRLLSAPSPESRDLVPPEVARLLSAAPGADAEAAWAAFLSAYSGLLLRVSSIFAPGYDGVLDRYAYMLDELRRSDCRRLRAFVADGRGQFSTWLTVVARRLCLDHYRQKHGRIRDSTKSAARASASRSVRRGLSDLAGTCDDLSCIPDPSPHDPAEDVDERDRRAALRRALDELAPSDQLLLQLRFEEGLTAREIAPLLGLPSQFHVYRRLETVCGAVRTRLRAPAGGSVRAPIPWRGRPSANLRRDASDRKCPVLGSTGV
jgi:RNA polymerase sigma factor (sigma-70 family)